MGQSISQAGFKWIGMSQSARYVPSPVCLEQIHRQCNCPSTGATAKQHQGLQEKLKTLSSPRHLWGVSPNHSITSPTGQTGNRPSRLSAKFTPCPKLFTFDLNTGNLNLGSSYPLLQSILANVERLGQTYAPTRAAAIDVWQRQIPIRDNSCLVAVTPSSLFPNPRPGYTTLGAHNSPALGLLASTNRKDGTPNSNRAHKLNKHARFLAHSFTHTETLAQQQQGLIGQYGCVPSSSALPLLSKDAMAIYLVSIILIRAGTNLEGVDSHS